MTGNRLPTIVVRDQLDRLGLTRHQLYALVASGELERIAPGYYLRTGALDDTTATLASIALRRPEATICLLSALAIHELTDEIPRWSDLALPRGTRTPRTDLAPVRWHLFDPKTYAIGRTRHQLTGSVRIGLYSAERTIVDVFRLRHLIGSDVANGTLVRWLRRRGSSPSQLLRVAEAFPTARPAIDFALEVLL